MLNDDRINFLRREADPCYTYYRFKLTYFSAQGQGSGDGRLLVVQILLGLIYNSCRKSSLSSFHRGLDFETRLRDTHANAPRFNFLRDSSGKYHKYYQHSLAYYSTENTS
ncbi:hypothetical protein F2Q69_00033662 [Brassica cretica]|uniref:SURP motif domain-containing protein n=1 Tax=Brassica cretica TaxID=69181 RepID=A0A8S9SQX1_BRACR|nr:hypothetical protein F2Q69_00033662 [Brassica cretica]